MDDLNQKDNDELLDYFCSEDEEIARSLGLNHQPTNLLYLPGTSEAHSRIISGHYSNTLGKRNMHSFTPIEEKDFVSPSSVFEGKMPIKISTDEGGKGPLLEGEDDIIYTKMIEYVQSEFALLNHKVNELEKRVNDLYMHVGEAAGLKAEQATDPTILSNSKLLHEHPQSLLNKELSRGTLDRYCLPTLEQNPDPTTASLNSIVHTIMSIPQYSHMEHRQTLSHVRKYFRKRREEMTCRLISALKRRELRLLSHEGVQEVRREFEEESYNLKVLVQEAKLEICNEQGALKFADSKLRSFLDRYKLE